MDVPFTRSFTQVIRLLGYTCLRNPVIWSLFAPFQGFTPDEISLIRSVLPYTMTSPERLQALIKAAHFIVKHDIPGDIVECGVWKGGSILCVAKTLKKLDSMDKCLYLYDTFTGMTKPQDVDISVTGESASLEFNKMKITDDSSRWSYSPLSLTKKIVYSSGYPENKVYFIKGKVEDTIPKNVPERISLLRLDTDWYESTLHELVHLFPRLSKGGVIIIDDYGYWLGARKAVDEYFSRNNIIMYLHKIDSTGRIGIKM